jgi:hypothetical protein
MKRSQLALAIAGLLASSQSFATAGVTDATVSPATGQSTWASELKSDQTGILTLPGVTTSPSPTLDVQVNTGFLIPASEVRFIRLNLSGNAKFVQTPGCTVPSVTTASCTRSLGGKGSDFVTFTLTASSSAAILPSSAVYFSNTGTTSAVGGIQVESTSSAIQMTYTLHTNKDSAESVSTPDTALLAKTGPFDYIKFTPGIVTTLNGGNELTSEVTANFLKFATANDSLGNFLADAEKGVLGTVAIGPSTNSVYIPLSSTSSGFINAGGTALSYLAGTGSTLDVSSVTAGGFTFLADVVNSTVTTSYVSAKNLIFLGASAADCQNPAATPTYPASSLNADKATFSLDGIISTTGSTTTTKFICIKANTVSVIPTNQYIGSISPGSTTISAPTKTTGNLNTIKQNGTVLDTPYITLLPATQYGSRVILQNTGNVSVPYTTKVVSDDGIAVTLGSKATGSVPANSLLQINIADLATVASGNRAAVRFVLTGPNTSLSGVYQTIKKRTDGTTGDIQSIPLMRQGGGAK